MPAIVQYSNQYS